MAAVCGWNGEEKCEERDVARLTKRDVEILRTLGRVKLVRTASLLGVFFSHPRLVQRRMAALRDEGLVVGHRKGAEAFSGNAGPHYWRLTRLGAELLEERFPEEEWARNAERAARISVRFFEHQDAIVSLYLRLIADKGLDEMCAKASAIVFRGDHDVELPYPTLGKQRLLYPDATAWAASGGARFFVEIDRSTVSRKRVVRTVEAYAHAAFNGNAARHFGDGRESYLVYATKTHARRDGLRHALRWKRFSGIRVAVLCLEEAIHWLHSGLFGRDAISADELLTRGLEAPAFAEARRDEETLLALRSLHSAFIVYLDHHGDTAPACLPEVEKILHRRGLLGQPEERV